MFHQKLCFTESILLVETKDLLFVHHDPLTVGRKTLRMEVKRLARNEQVTSISTAGSPHPVSPFIAAATKPFVHESAVQMSSTLMCVKCGRKGSRAWNGSHKLCRAKRYDIGTSRRKLIPSVGASR